MNCGVYSDHRILILTLFLTRNIHNQQFVTIPEQVAVILDQCYNCHNKRCVTISDWHNLYPIITVA